MSNTKLAGLSGAGVLALLGLGSECAWAQLRAYEPFDYPVGAPLAGQSGGGSVGFISPWQESFDAPSSDDVRAGSLSFGAGTKVLSASGQSVASPLGGLAAMYGVIGRNLNSQWGYGANSTGTLFASYVVRPTNMGVPIQGPFGGLVFTRSDGAGGSEPVFVGDTAGSYSVEAEGGTGAHSSSGVQSRINNTAFLVIRFTFRDSTADTVDLWVNPTPGGTLPASPSASINLVSEFDRLELIQGGLRMFIYDELRLGGTYADVAPIGQLVELLWDTDLGTSGAQGGSGVWASGGANWWDGGANVTWNDSAEAVFGASPGNVTVSGAVTARSLRFDTAGYVLQGGTVALSTGSITANADVTIESELAGTAGLSKLGAGRLRLAGTNSFVGNVAVIEGRMEISEDANLGDPTNSVTISGGTLALVDHDLSLSAGRLIASAGIGGAIDVPAGLTLSILGTLSVGPESVLHKTGAGTLHVMGPQDHAELTTVQVDEGTVRLGTDAGPGESYRLAVAVNASAIFEASQHLASLQIAQGGQAQLTAGGDKVIVTGGLTLSGSGATMGRLDLADNDLVVRATAVDRAQVLGAVVAAIANARGPAGTWDGGGLTSSAAAADPNQMTTLASAINDDGTGKPLFASFDGQAVDENSVLVKYTYYGDLDLNGRVNIDDYFRMDRGFANGLQGYVNGDVNYSGAVDGDDFFLADLAFSLQGDVVLSAGGAAAVPEPGTGALIAVAAGLLARRRRSIIRRPVSW